MIIICFIFDQFPSNVDYWGNLSTCFEYLAEIRTAIYTTNAIEAMHRQIRTVTKTKETFTSDQTLLKLVYLAVKDLFKKCTMPIRNWGLDNVAAIH